MTGRQKMKNITIALPQIVVDNLQKIQDSGMIPNRSEGLRIAIRAFLKKEIGVCELFGISGDE